MKARKAYGTDIIWYTIVHRKKHERKCYSFGYRSEDLGTLRELAQREADEGVYSCVKIINASTNEDKEYFTKARR